MRTYVLVLLLLAPAALASAAEPKKPVWREDLTDVSIPSVPAQGMVHGVAFKVEKARLTSERVLELKPGKEFSADGAIRIILDRRNLAPAEIVDGKKFESTSSRDHPGGFVRQTPAIYLTYNVEGEKLPKALANAAEPKKPVWREDLTNVSIPSVPAQGMVHGVAFKVEEARLIAESSLELRQGKGLFADRAIHIHFLDPAPAKILDGKKFESTSSRDHPGGFVRQEPRISLTYKVEGENLPRRESFNRRRRYTMKLHFSKRTGNKIQAKIYLCLPDKAKSFVAGVFEAEITSGVRPLPLDWAAKAEAFSRYTMKLHFSKRTGNKIKGEIYLCLPDTAKSFVAGTFEAEIWPPNPGDSRSRR